MQKHVNLVDLVKSFPTNIYLQNLASIQKRMSPVKFAHLAEKSGKGSISNFSTKVAGLARKAGVSESSVEVAFSAGSVKVDASIQVPPELAKDAAAIMAELTKPSNGSELLQSLAAQPKFNELKEDPRKDFTVSWV